LSRSASSAARTASTARSSSSTRARTSRCSSPAPEEDSYYVFQLVGLDVVEEGGRRLGAVQEVAPGIANDVLELDSGLALPMVEECVRRVDLEAGRIVVSTGFADG
jgi:16S rRNA processing protein RimM